MIQRRFNKLFLIGLYFFVAANTWGWLMRHSTKLSEGWVDGIHGLFIGLAVGCMLLSIAYDRGYCRRDAPGGS